MITRFMIASPSENASAQTHSMRSSALGQFVNGDCCGAPCRQHRRPFRRQKDGLGLSQSVRLGVVKGEQYPSCIPEALEGLKTRSIDLHPCLDPDFTGVNQLI